MELNNQQMKKSYRKGELILEEGASGSEAYIINSGTVEVFCTIEGQRVVLAHLTEDQMFGEMSMIDDRPRSASVTALTDVEATVIDREQFNELFYSRPELLKVFLKNIFERLRNMDQALVSLTAEVSTARYFGNKFILSGITPQAKSVLPGKSVEIEKFPYKIGRKTKNFTKDLFSNNDLYISDIMPYNVSRNHLSIRYNREKFFVLDRGSTLGTIVNEMRIGGPSKIHELELSRNNEHTLILGNSDSPFQFNISVP